MILSNARMARNNLLPTFIMILLGLPLSKAMDCYGKPFRCVNSSHFMICVELGNGVSSTMDEFYVPCPITTICDDLNDFECEYPVISTTSITLLSDGPTEPILVEMLEANTTEANIWDEVVTFTTGSQTNQNNDLQKYSQTLNEKTFTVSNYSVNSTYNDITNMSMSNNTYENYESNLTQVNVNTPLVNSYVTLTPKEDNITNTIDISTQEYNFLYGTTTVATSSSNNNISISMQKNTSTTIADLKGTDNNAIDLDRITTNNIFQEITNNFAIQNSTEEKTTQFNVNVNATTNIYTSGTTGVDTSLIKEQNLMTSVSTFGSTIDFQQKNTSFQPTEKSVSSKETFFNNTQDSNPNNNEESTINSEPLGVGSTNIPIPSVLNFTVYDYSSFSETTDTNMETATNFSTLKTEQMSVSTEASSIQFFTFLGNDSFSNSTYTGIEATTNLQPINTEKNNTNNYVPSIQLSTSSINNTDVNHDTLVPNNQSGIKFINDVDTKYTSVNNKIDLENTTVEFNIDSTGSEIRTATPKNQALEIVITQTEHIDILTPPEHYTVNNTEQLIELNNFSTTHSPTESLYTDNDFKMNETETRTTVPSENNLLQDLSSNKDLTLLTTANDVLANVLYQDFNMTYNNETVKQEDQQEGIFNNSNSTINSTNLNFSSSKENFTNNKNTTENSTTTIPEQISQQIVQPEKTYTGSKTDTLTINSDKNITQIKESSGNPYFTEYAIENPHTSESSTNINDARVTGQTKVTGAQIQNIIKITEPLLDNSFAAPDSYVATTASMISFQQNDVTDSFTDNNNYNIISEPINTYTEPVAKNDNYNAGTETQQIFTEMNVMLPESHIVNSSELHKTSTSVPIQQMITTESPDQIPNYTTSGNKKPGALKQLTQSINDNIIIPVVTRNIDNIVNELHKTPTSVPIQQIITTESLDQIPHYTISDIKKPGALHQLTDNINIPARTQPSNNDKAATQNKPSHVNNAGVTTAANTFYSATQSNSTSLDISSAQYTSSDSFNNQGKTISRLGLLDSTLSTTQMSSQTISHTFGSTGKGRNTLMNVSKIQELSTEPNTYHVQSISESLRETSSFKKTEAFSVNINCTSRARGRYSDENDCKVFYVCIGLLHPITGRCPVNTVFSEITKQCTRNLSHCVRGNEFKCIKEGRFSDYLYDNVYYICVKAFLNLFYRYKLQCQNGYILDKINIKCVLSPSNLDSSSKSESDQKSETSFQSSYEGFEFHCTKEGTFPHPNNCRKYYVCVKRNATLRRQKKKCNDGDIFDKNKKKCVEADSYEC